MSSRPESAAPIAGTTPEAVRAQLLATEHWSLLATRSTTMSEMLTRITTFLMLVSSSIVGLALIGQFTHFDERFAVFALILLGALAVIGTLTGMRVANASIEDLALVIGMNRLRAGYLEIDPEVEHYFVTSAHDDSEGVWRTYNPLFGPNPQFRNVLASSGSFITFLTAGLTAAFAAVASVAAGAPIWLTVLVAAVCGLGFVAASVVLGIRSFRRIQRNVLFPSQGDAATSATP
jgi:hypothetical protein